MDPARRAESSRSAHSELDAILREADAARRSAGREASPSSEDAKAPPAREAPPRRTTRGTPTPDLHVVRFDTFDVRVEDPGENKSRTLHVPSRLWIALGLGVLAIYAWVALPAGLDFLRPQPLPDSYKEASARWAMVLTSRRIDRFRAQHFRLPASLDELGPGTLSDIGYERLSETQYRLQAPGQYRPLTIGPTTSRAVFLDDALNVLRLGPDKAP